jgi:ABC-2 type transport system ATP-binding protein
MLEIRDISKRFAGIPALESASFVARPGQVTGYLGPNGSGKSTTVKIITGLIAPSSGHVYWKGSDVRDDLEAFRGILGYVPEEPHLYSHLSGFEYLQLTGDLRQIQRPVLERRAENFLRAFGLWEDRWSLISSYSKGMRQKVLLAAALLHDPELVVLDEPFSGLDVHTALVLRELIRALAASGKTVLFSSHELDTVEKVAARVVILHRGKVVANDSVSNLRQLMALASLEAIFTQLAVQGDPAESAAQLIAGMRA